MFIFNYWYKGNYKYKVEILIVLYSVVVRGFRNERYLFRKEVYIGNIIFLFKESKVLFFLI